jgi:hypothetical protein
VTSATPVSAIVSAASAAFRSVMRIASTRGSTTEQKTRTSRRADESGR